MIIITIFLELGGHVHVEGSGLDHVGVEGGGPGVHLGPVLVLLLGQGLPGERISFASSHCFGRDLFSRHKKYLWYISSGRFLID